MERMTPQDLDHLEGQILSCMGRERAPLRRRLAVLRRRLQQGRAGGREYRTLAQDIAASRQSVAQRRSVLPSLRFPAELPITGHRAEIERAIAAHQLVIVCGETGSGKTTQLPKICLAMGRGTAGLIGHTQPRRIAARSVARRIAEELGDGGGQWVGHKIRFQDHTRPETRIKLMTDGMLLAEIQYDRLLEAYDTLIIDEAHERSLNIDFLLGYLKQLLPQRPDLKVIITSATIDPSGFARHFGGAPVIEVSGRGYPVEIRYRPAEEYTDGDQQMAMLHAVDELAREGPGDILIFLSGERDIRDTTEALRKHHPPGTEILPLYSRLSSAEQDRVFRPHQGRRIVLATNVAETSLTVPGIHYVIDGGRARISRYSHRSKVQRLPIEKISQASAKQRAGRCGRVAAGICIRLYSESDHDGRPLFTAPEIRRTNLASVILQMKLLNLGDIEDFPFMDPPDGRFIRDGYRLLHELQALDGEGRLTPVGRQIAALPLDPRLGRMIVAASHYHCLREILIIVSALSIQDPRERPADKRDAAAEAQRRYQDKRSDFLAWLKLWEEVTEQQRHLSNNKFRKFCRSRFLSYLRLREWRDIHHQILQQAKGMGLTLNQAPAHYADIHLAILSGLLGQVAMKGEEGEYLGARNNKLTLFPGSALCAHPPKWIMAGELLETTRLYALHAARIETQWIEELAGHLLKRDYYEPHWHRKRAQVMAFERVTLYGLVVNARRRVAYARLDPATAREIFLQALVNGEVSAHAPFMAHNLHLLEEITRLENKLRRRDLADEKRPLYDFYRERIPCEICDGRSFERWRRRVERSDPRFLYAEREQIMAGLEGAAPEASLPDSLLMDGLRLPLEYHFSPGEAQDGITLIVPLAALNKISPHPCQWLVPGLRQEKILALIKSLPKSLRRNFVPATNFASACLEALDPSQGPLLDALGDHLERMTGVTVPHDAWQPHKLPAHLHMHFRVVDEAGQTLAQGEDLSALQQELATAAGQSFDRLLEQGQERRAITCWDFGELSDKATIEHNGLTLEAYPGLVDEGDSVALRMFDTADKARQESRAGLRRLIMLQLAEPLRHLSTTLDSEMRKACLHYASLGPCNELRRELLAAIIDEVFVSAQALPRSEADFKTLVAQGREGLAAQAQAFCRLLTEILESYQQLHKALRRPLPPAWLPAVSDMRSQLDHLVWRGFVSATPRQYLQHYPRYLEAVARRLRKLEEDPARDLVRLREIKPIWEGYLRQQRDAAQRHHDEDRWLIEELRVSLFAQELKTAVKVSPLRLARYA